MSASNRGHPTLQKIKERIAKTSRSCACKTEVTPPIYTWCELHIMSQTYPITCLERALQPVCIVLPPRPSVTLGRSSYLLVP